MIADSVAFCVERGKRRRSTTPSTSSTATATTPATRSSACEAAVDGRRRERHPLRHQRLAACPTRSPRRPPPSSPTLGERVEIGIHTHNDAECGGRQLAGRGATRAPALVQGTHQRLRRALRQRQPGLDPAGAAAEDGLRGGQRRAARRADRRRPTSSTSSATSPRTPTRPTSAATPSPTRAGMHVAGVEADARTFEHLDPAAGRQPARRPALRALRQGDDPQPGRARPGSSSTTRPPPARSSGSRSASTDGYHYEAAPASFELLLRREAGSYKPLFKLESFRVVTEKRADGEVETEATIKVEVDGERYLRVAEGNGPVNALDRALRGAIADRYPHLADDRADQLQGADPRRSPRHRRRHPGPARLRRRRARVGDDRRLGEHHRGLLGGAGRLAGVRLPVSASQTAAQIPLAAARDRRPRGGAGARGAALGTALAGADGGALRARVRRLARGRGRGRRLQRHDGAAPRRAGARLGRRATRS